MQKLYQLLGTLHCPVQLFSATGKRLFPKAEGELAPSVLSKISTSPCKIGTQYFVLSQSHLPFIVACPCDNVWALDVLNLVNALLLNEEKEHKIKNIKDFFTHLCLNESLAEHDVKALAEHLNVILAQGFYVFHFMLHKDEVKAEEALKTLYPSGTKDVLFTVGGNTCTVVHFVSFEQRFDVYDFVEALSLTVQEELSSSFCFGISEFKTSLVHLPLAFKEAKDAIDIAKKIEKKNTTVFFDRLLLERVVLALPIELRQHFIAELLSKDVAGALNEEMQSTIKTFLEEDLNLSETARRLFVHRNTLVYRLEKIQKILGLDLKKFADSSVYHLVSTMQKLTEN